MEREIIIGEPLTPTEVHQGIFSYEYEGRTYDINRMLYYNESEERFEHSHNDDVLVVWPYRF